MFQKDGPFALRLLSPPLFLLLLSLPLLLSFFNVHPVKPANYLKTKDLRKRHFRLIFFESRETPKTQNVRRKMRPITHPLPRRPYTPHAPETDPTCSAAKPYIM